MVSAVKCHPATNRSCCTSEWDKTHNRFPWMTIKIKREIYKRNQLLRIFAKFQRDFFQKLHSTKRPFTLPDHFIIVRVSKQQPMWFLLMPTETSIGNVLSLHSEIKTVFKRIILWNSATH